MTSTTTAPTSPDTQEYDSSNFGGRNHDKVIELRFVLDAIASTSAYEGWWIDNIKVEDRIERRYTVGFEDNMEGVSHWYPSGTGRAAMSWSTAAAGWSDSPGVLPARHQQHARADGD